MSITTKGRESEHVFQVSGSAGAAGEMNLRGRQLGRKGDSAGEGDHSSQFGTTEGPGRALSQKRTREKDFGPEGCAIRRGAPGRRGKGDLGGERFPQRSAMRRKSDCGSSVEKATRNRSRTGNLTHQSPQSQMREGSHPEWQVEESKRSRRRETPSRRYGETSVSRGCAGFSSWWRNFQREKKKLQSLGEGLPKKLPPWGPCSNKPAVEAGPSETPTAVWPQRKPTRKKEFSPPKDEDHRSEEDLAFQRFPRSTSRLKIGFFRKGIKL